MRAFAAFALVLSVVSVRAFVDIRVPQPDDSAVVEATPQQQVHVVFSSHLDIGFDKQGRGGWDDTIINIYFNEHFPKALATADAMRNNGTDRYRYMTQSFLVSLFLDCPPNLGLDCPNDTAVEAFLDRVARGNIFWHALPLNAELELMDVSLPIQAFLGGVARGDIFWHALPFNAELELMDASLLAASVQLTHEIDAQLGLPPKITMSQRDVLGFSRSAVPVLMGQGIQAVTVGTNGGCAPPAVPHNTPFIWRDLRSGAQLLAMWHPGGYSGLPVDNGPDECVTAKGFSHVLCAAWHVGDNSGPHSPDEAADIFRRVRAAFPGANVSVSTFDEYTVQLVAAAPTLDLPVFTQEIGDTWIYGVQSDADKVAEFRAFMRMRRTMPDQFSSYAMRNFTRFLLKVPEHTWGVDIKTYLPDYADWSNAQLDAQLANKTDMFIYTETAWTRQRSYTRYALQALGSTPAGLKMWGVLSELEELKQVPNTSGFQQLNPGDNLTFVSHAWNISLDPTSGALSGLQRRWASKNRVGAQWANASRPLGRFVYSTYTEADYDVLWDEYLYIDPSVWWIQRDLGKYNASSANPLRSDTSAVAQGAWVKQDSPDSFEVLVVAALPQRLVDDAGAPAQLWYHITSPASSDALLFDVLWVNKTPSRLPEALWAEFKPDATVADPDSWLMSKIGSPVSPSDIVLNGSHSMHGVDDDGVSVTGYGSKLAWEQLQIRTLDTALVSPGVATPFPNVKHTPDMMQGMTFCLGNNIWGTNYVMWQPYLQEAANQRFRFELRMSDLGATSARQQAWAAQ